MKRPSVHGCGESKQYAAEPAIFSLPCMVNKPALDTHCLRVEGNTAILSILGLSQGYIMRGEQS